MQPQGGCLAGTPYLAALLAFVSCPLLLASLLVPWYYAGGQARVPGSTSRSWGVAVGLTSLTYCDSYMALDSLTGLEAEMWFTRTIGCEARSLRQLGLSTGPFTACVALCSLGLILHAAALLLTLCSSCCGLAVRPASPTLRLAHAGMLGARALPAALVLVGVCVALGGLPPAQIFRAAGSPQPGIQEAAGAVLAKAAAALGCLAAACEGGYLAALAARLSAVAALQALPTQPPEQPPQPTDLEARALVQAQAAMASGSLDLLLPRPVLPEDARAYGVEEAGKAADLYYCRVRLYSGAPLVEQAAGGGAEEAVHLVLRVGGVHTRLTVKLGEAAVAAAGGALGGEGPALPSQGFCTACGAGAAPGASFCGQCGAAVQAAPGGGGGGQLWQALPVQGPPLSSSVPASEALPAP